jgi:hypothetical protein
MRLLLDENLDWRLGRGLLGHEVESVQRLRWAGMQNGILLKKAAETGFEVLIHKARSSSNRLPQADGPTTKPGDAGLPAATPVFKLAGRVHLPNLQPNRWAKLFKNSG